MLTLTIQRVFLHQFCVYILLLLVCLDKTLTNIKKNNQSHDHIANRLTCSMCDRAVVYCNAMYGKLYRVPFLSSKMSTYLILQR